MNPSPQRLQYLRTLFGYSIRELAGKVNCSKQSIFNWEKGANLPSAAAVKALCAIYEMTNEQLSDENYIPKQYEKVLDTSPKKTEESATASAPMQKEISLENYHIFQSVLKTGIICLCSLLLLLIVFVIAIRILFMKETVPSNVLGRNSAITFDIHFIYLFVLQFLFIPTIFTMVFTFVKIKRKTKKENKHV